MADTSGMEHYNTGFKFFFGVLLFLAPWLVIMKLLYSGINSGNFIRGMFYTAKVTPHSPVLLASLFLGFILTCFYIYLLPKKKNTGFGGQEFFRKIRGPEFISPEELTQKCREPDKKQFSFIGTPVATAIENLHFMLVGSTGGGKSQAILQQLVSIKNSGRARTIVVDPNGGFMQSLFRSGDRILNPFDARSEGWSIINEIRTLYDTEQYALSLIPIDDSVDREAFNSMARTLISEVLKRVAATRSALPDINAELYRVLVSLSTPELKKYLEGSIAAGLVTDGKGPFESLKSIIANSLAPHRFIKKGDFSIRDWLENGTGNLWITWREDQIANLKPLITCWIDVISVAILSMPPETIKSPIVMITDELDSLGRLTYYEQLATKGRKHKITLIAGIQSFAQLKKTYGENSALSLRNSFGSIAICQIAPNDTFTPVESSKIFGQHEVERYKVSKNTDDGKGSRTLQKETEYLVTPSEISALPALTYYFRLAQSNYICKATLAYLKLSPVCSGFILDTTNVWAMSPEKAMQQQDASQGKASATENTPPLQPVSGPSGQGAPEDFWNS